MFGSSINEWVNYKVNSNPQIWGYSKDFSIHLLKNLDISIIDIPQNLLVGLVA